MCTQSTVLKRVGHAANRICILAPLRLNSISFLSSSVSVSGADGATWVLLTRSPLFPPFSLNSLPCTAVAVAVFEETEKEEKLCSNKLPLVVRK